MKKSLSSKQQKLKITSKLKRENKLIAQRAMYNRNVSISVKGGLK